MFWSNAGNDEAVIPEPRPKRKQPRRCHCPVCKKYLGLQEEGMEISLHCEECRAWFTYFPGIKKPTAKLDRDMPQICTCGGCRQRRGED